MVISLIAHFRYIISISCVLETIKTNDIKNVFKTYNIAAIQTRFFFFISVSSFVMNFSFEINFSDHWFSAENMFYHNTKSLEI